MARTVLTEHATYELPDGTDLFLSEADAARVTGWEAKPEGMCRGEICVPLPRSMRDGGDIDVAGFWRLLGAPVLSEGDTWMLGVAAEERAAALDALDAPDFALPDLAGVQHRLSGLRGRKVLLATWASW